MGPDTLLTIDELAAFLKRSRQTILNDRVRNPAAVPPSITLPNTKHILFRFEDVSQWLVGLRSAPPTPAEVVPTPRRRGRPPKVKTS
jgi:hypothetical protein